MITHVETNNQQAMLFKKACLYYRRIYNLYFDYILSKSNLVTAGNRISRRFEHKADSRLYQGVAHHIAEHKEKLNIYSDFMTLRLQNVDIINGQFIFNGITFTFPELIYINCNVKKVKLFQSYKKINAKILNEDITYLVTNDQHYINEFNYEDEYSYIIEPELFKLVVGAI